MSKTDPIAQLDKPLFGRFGRVVGFVMSSIILAWLLTVIAVAIFEFFNGPHPECANSTSVLPCGYLARIGEEVTHMTPLPVIPFFLIVLLIRFIGMAVRLRHSRKA